ncbi:MAG: nickel transporter [Crenarchaeota archaeon]|nr:nickel transporter [Thermoproteota archaeon]
MLIIPSIDISRGLAVKRIQGVEGTETVKMDPMQVLKTVLKYVGKIRRIHIVDLDGAREGRPINVEVILRLIREAKERGLEVQIGGGIRRLDHALIYARENADVVLGSIIFKNPQEAERIIRELGPEKVYASIDVKSGRIAISGWIETVDVDPISQLSVLDIRNIIYTCIDVEGKMQGPMVNRELINKIRYRLSLKNLYYAGGVRDKHDVKYLKAEGFNGVIIGMAMYVKGLEHFLDHE